MAATQRVSRYTWRIERARGWPMEAPADTTWRGFSLNERDRRWQSVRENAAVVMPTDGRPPIVITERGEGNQWVPEPRSVNRGMRGSWGPAMAQAVLDLGLERARIGVVG